MDLQLIAQIACLLAYLPLDRPFQPHTVGYFDKNVVFAMDLGELVLVKNFGFPYLEKAAMEESGSYRNGMKLSAKPQ
jgi:hypothetical protein